ncbi:glycosyltransferase family 2 protein [uncultured Roseobacter sp.]|uniref:glycosyltransferase family 2 protein n=1 Tax=uncultured Roseobacter sp. TaxID=114847 RepID=UPI002622E3FE|nr:glycosyltransferase family 2 protein [uncultured Roseobacter sp.]
MHNRIRIATVTYNSAGVIGNLLDSVPEGVEVVVADNNSTDDTCRIVEEAGVRLIRLEQNRGFGTGCNAGAAGNTREFIFFVNPDATLTPDCCRLLVKAADAHPAAVAFNPAVLNSRGRIRLNRRSALLPRRDWTPRSYGGTDNDLSVEVRLLHGAALFCRQAAFEAIGGFDETIFLYHEDDDLSVRLQQAGGKLRLEHAAKLMHLGGKSSGGSVATAQLKAYLIAQSRIYVETKHGKSAPGLQAYLRATAKLLSPLTLLSRRKRAQALSYLRGVREFDLESYSSGK